MGVAAVKEVVPSHAAITRRMITINEQGVAVELPGAYWTLFDKLYGTNPVKRRLTIQRLFDEWNVENRKRPLLERTKRGVNTTGFSAFVQLALAVEAGLRLPDVAESAPPEKVDIKVMIDRATYSRLNTAERAPDTIVVRMEAPLVAFSDLDVFALTVRNVENRARQRFGLDGTPLHPEHALAFQAVVRYDAPSETFVAEGLALAQSQDPFDHVADLYLDDIRANLPKQRFHVALFHENGNTVWWE